MSSIHLPNVSIFLLSVEFNVICCSWKRRSSLPQRSVTEKMTHSSLQLIQSILLSFIKRFEKPRFQFSFNKFEINNTGYYMQGKLAKRFYSLGPLVFGKAC